LVYIYFNINNIFILIYNFFNKNLKKKVIHYRYTNGDQKILTEKSCVPSEINEFKIVEGKTNIYTLSCIEKDETGLCRKKII